MAEVGAIALLKAGKGEERLKHADNNVLGTAAVGMGSCRCGPGAGATSFGDAPARDECALSKDLRCQNGGAGATASSSTSGSTGSRSSPATTRWTSTGVPALGNELSFEKVCWTRTSLES